MILKEVEKNIKEAEKSIFSVFGAALSILVSLWVLGSGAIWVVKDLWKEWSK